MAGAYASSRYGAGQYRDINELLDYLLESASYGEAADARQQIIAWHPPPGQDFARCPLTGTGNPDRELTGSRYIFRQLVVKKAYRIIYADT